MQERRLSVTLTFPRTRPFEISDINALKKAFPDAITGLAQPIFYIALLGSSIRFKEKKNSIEISSATQKALIQGLETILKGFKKLEEFQGAHYLGLPYIHDYAHVTVEEKTEIENFYAQKTREFFPVHAKEIDAMMEDFVEVVAEKKPESPKFILFKKWDEFRAKKHQEKVENLAQDWTKLRGAHSDSEMTADEAMGNSKLTLSPRPSSSEM